MLFTISNFLAPFSSESVVPSVESAMTGLLKGGSASGPDATSATLDFLFLFCSEIFYIQEMICKFKVFVHLHEIYYEIY
jgi:hypothetical protein